MRFTSCKTQIIQDRDGACGLLVERFVRVFDRSSKSFVSLHLQDACQFLKRYPHDKYGVHMREIAEGIRTFSTTPQVEIAKLIELYIFSYLIGNRDLHAKNISLLEGPTQTRVLLSPAYDIVCTLPYADRKMALRLGEKDDNFTSKDIIEFAKMFLIPEKAILSSIKKLTQKWNSTIALAVNVGLDEKHAKDILRTFGLRAGQLS